MDIFLHKAMAIVYIEATAVSKILSFIIVPMNFKKLFFHNAEWCIFFP